MLKVGDYVEDILSIDKKIGKIVMFSGGYILVDFGGSEKLYDEDSHPLIKSTKGKVKERVNVPETEVRLETEPENQTILNEEELKELLDFADEEIDKYKKEIEEYIKIIKVKDKEIEKLSGNIKDSGDSKLDNGESSVTNNRLNKLIKEKEDQIQKKCDKIIDLNFNIEHLEKTLEEKEDDIKNLNVNLEDKDNEISDLNEDIEYMEKVVDEKKIEINKLNKKIQGKNKEIKEKISEINNLNENIEVLEETIEEKGEEIEELGEQISGLEQTNEELRVANNELRKIKEELEKKLAAKVIDIKPKILNFDLLPSGNWDIEDIISYYRRIDTKSNPDLIGKTIEIERLSAIKQLKPVECYVGRRNWSGYIVFTFARTSNVILECPFEGNATYVIHGDWKKYVRGTRQELRDNYPTKYTKCVHKGDWFDRVKGALRGIRASKSKTSRGNKKFKKPKNIHEALNMGMPELIQVIRLSLLKRPNHACPKKDLVKYVLQQLSIRTYGAPREAFNNLLNIAVKTMVNSGSIKQYQISKNVRVKLL